MSTSQDPFGLLLALAGRSVGQARGLPAQVEAAPTWTGIGFMLAGQRMVAPMAQIAELIHMPGCTPLPGVKHWVSGVANVRGRLLPLIDLEAYFGGQLTGPAKTRRVLAIEQGELYTGLLVSEVIGMIHFPTTGFMDRIPREAAPFLAYSEGCYVHEQLTWTVFCPHRLVRDGQFINAAA
jgi:twitching motility protein PilI